MSELSSFRDHARRMAEAEHNPECPWSNPARVERESMKPIWGPRYSPDGTPEALVLTGFTPQIGHCPGCVSDADRALWRRLADEVDAYLSHEHEEGLFV